MRRGFLFLLIAVLAAGLLVAPASAAKKCGKYRPAEPLSDSLSRTEVPSTKVVTVTDKHTSDKPLVIEYDHGPAFWLINDPSGSGPQGQAAVLEDTKWFNIQVDTKAKTSSLSIRQQWTAAPISDIDLYIWVGFGNEITRSADFNHLGGTPLATTGGHGFEEVTNFYASDCMGFTVESRAFWTPGDAMQLIISVD